MRTPFGNPEIVATEIGCHFRQNGNSPDRIVRPMFGPVAKVLWPFKTAAHLAAIANTSERAAARWVSGEIDPPGIVLAAVLVELTKRQ